jgi:hypothetical protein
MANPNAGKNGKNSRFSSDKQPHKRGRPKSKFGPLSKENDLSLDDTRKLFKNILTAKSFDYLDTIQKKYPSILTEQTIAMLKQDKLGRLTGRKMKVKTGDKDEFGNDIMREIDERIKSYETIQCMLDRIYGSPAKTDLTVLNQTDIVIGEPPPPEEAYPD